MKRWTILIFGVTGDLARKKLIPALAALCAKQRELNCIGIARDVTDTEALIAQIKPEIRNEKEFEAFAKNFSALPLDFEKAQDYEQLKHHIESIEAGSESNRLAYLAAPAQFFCAITQQLAQSGCIVKQSSAINHLIVYEKPFGSDLTSAQEINACIDRYYNQEMIFRIDHYLTKSLVNSLGLLRFANSLFEPVWNNSYLDQVHVCLSETESIAGRGSFYDRFGVLKDVVQNHVLQLLSLVTMEPPEKYTAQSLSSSKSQVLNAVQITDGILGQYNGYETENGVREESRTETFAALTLGINTQRWHNVRFFIKAGKNLNKKSTEITLVFKSISREYFGLSGSFDPNIITIRISPDSGISWQLNLQKAGVLHDVIPLTVDFCYHCLFGPESPGAYEVLLDEIMDLDRAISVSWQEIESAWRIIDALEQRNLPLYRYAPGTAGPAELDGFMKNHQLLRVP